MKFVLAAGIVVVVSALAPLGGYAAEKGSEAHIEKFMPAIDAALSKQIQSDLSKDKPTSASNIKVETSKGVVKLSGTAKSKADADKAAAVAKGTYGVKGVQNDIQVTGK